jgi:serine/threonine protein kinase
LDRLGRFTLLELVGDGSFGFVYRAHDPQLDREVALKVAKPDAHSTPGRVESFLSEARSAAGLRNPKTAPCVLIGRNRSSG